VASFTISAPVEPVRLRDGTGSAAFVVTNTADQPVQGRVMVMPNANAPTDWFTLSDPTTHVFAAGAVEPAVVSIAVPPSTAPGSYILRLAAVNVDNPEEDFTEGPPVSFDVVPVIPREPWWKRYWWALALGALVLLIILAIAIF
jgi:hypothetical protein